MQKVLGLLGRKGAGKDTAAKSLMERGWVRLAFADPLYREVAEAFSTTVEFFARRETKETPQAELALYRCRDQIFVAVLLDHAGLRIGAVEHEDAIREFIQRDRSPREIMQLWGTEYKRKLFRDDYWIEQVRQAIKAQPTADFVITDVRFPNEAAMIQVEFSGMLARVIRPSLEHSQDDAGMAHASETLMQAYPADVELVNQDGPDGLALLDQAVVEKILQVKNAADV